MDTFGFRFQTGSQFVGANLVDAPSPQLCLALGLQLFVPSAFPQFCLQETFQTFPFTSLGQCPVYLVDCREAGWEVGEGVLVGGALGGLSRRLQWLTIDGTRGRTKRIIHP